MQVVVYEMRMVVHQNWMMQVVVYEMRMVVHQHWMKKVVVVSWSHQP
jgi:hypothetical protein